MVARKEIRFIPGSYRLQACCADCAHVFVRMEYEGNDELYCTLAASPRPPCMSILMGEDGPMLPWGTRNEGREKWDAWKHGRNVLPHGISDLYRHK